jgi:hypothetical protein
VPSLADVASNRTTVVSSTSLTTTVNASAGDVLVVKAVTSDSTVNLTTPTDTQGNSYTLRSSIGGSGHCNVYVWTARAATSTSNTVTHTRNGPGGAYSALSEVWHAADLAVTPAVYSGNGTTSAPSGSLTTTQDNSAVSWCDGDWAANSPAGRVYSTTSGTPVEEYVDDQSGSTVYVGYYAYQTAGTHGSQTFGITTPSVQTWTLAGIEVLDVPAASGDDQNQFGRFPWQ